MESGKKRTGTDYKHAFGHLFDPVRKAYAVQRPQFERPENQEVQRSLEKFSGFSHARIISTFDIECQ